MERRARIGPKGQVTIPKEIRIKTGITEYSEVIIETRDNSIVIRKIKPESLSYVDFYTSTYAKKLKEREDFKKIIEEQYNNLLH
jgi:AbrB family looped-hinge helix DNA binding protein